MQNDIFHNTIFCIFDVHQKRIIGIVNKAYLLYLCAKIMI
jgi:hypothetical protein